MGPHIDSAIDCSESIKVYLFLFRNVFKELSLLRDLYCGLILGFQYD